MDWANERYIRLYTRDTGDWLMWSWQTRALFVFILRKVDRSGLLQLGKGKLAALAAIVGMPSRDVTEWIAPLLEDGCVQIHDGTLCVPNFIAAQETPQSDKARQRASRERARAGFMEGEHANAAKQEKAESLPTSEAISSQSSEREPESQHVTPSHAPSQSVTPSLAKPSQYRPSHADPDARASSALPPQAADPESPFDLALRVWSEGWLAKYKRPFIRSTITGANGDDGIFQRLGHKAFEQDRPEAWMRHWTRSYFRDAEVWLVNNSHPLNGIEKRLNKYGEPKGPPRSGVRPVASQMPAEHPPVLLDMAELSKRSAALAKLGKATG